METNDNNIQKYSTIVIRSKPSHATVIVNAENRLTPVFLKLENRDLPYDIVIKKDGYVDHIQKVEIHSGEKIEINAVLQKKGKRRRQHNISKLQI